ncbi:hypothetical protein CBR_g4804 [Chara braunii]|uniref:Sphingomyelin synthase-like domain-containing protein n=1 Tax=Chara braunii TaxID=69332 RepID=A0A388KIW6_CHABU|nr:hypothetical protein CBR_g4804 [Chara braunii]|eukprot:GBG69976.1 hypothetical protein CBR_g4804 [Chara braunii]
MGDGSPMSSGEVAAALGVMKGVRAAAAGDPSGASLLANKKGQEVEEGDYVVKLGVPFTASSHRSGGGGGGGGGGGEGGTNGIAIIAKIVGRILSILRWEGKVGAMRRNRKKQPLGATSSSISPRFLNLGTLALIYVVVDYWRETGTWLSPHAADAIQTLLWTGLAAAAMIQALHYKHFTPEIVLIPRFLGSILFMLTALAIEAVFVHHVTAGLGLTWHQSTPPLPDYGELLLLWSNDYFPEWLIALLRAPVIGLHHFLMLFLMLAFSVIFGCIRPAGVGLGSRYMTAMGLGRLLRVLVFAGTTVPSPRPWCAETRFPYLPAHPQPFIREFYTPYVRGAESYTNTDTLSRYRLLKLMLATDSHTARETWWHGQRYPDEYRPDWGVFQPLAYLLRPWDPSMTGGTGGQAYDWLSILRRAGGGCNDLFYSGHVLVATLTAMAYQDAYPGWTSWMVWALLGQSALREIRERHHYTADVVVGLFVGVALWRLTKRFGWCTEEEDYEDEARSRRDALILRAAKDGDMGRVIDLLTEKEGVNEEMKGSLYVKLRCRGSTLCPSRRHRSDGASSGYRADEASGYRQTKHGDTDQTNASRRHVGLDVMKMKEEDERYQEGNNGRLLNLMTIVSDGEVEEEVG